MSSPLALIGDLFALLGTGIQTGTNHQANRCADSYEYGEIIFEEQQPKDKAKTGTQHQPQTGISWRKYLVIEVILVFHGFSPPSHSDVFNCHPSWISTL